MRSIWDNEFYQDKPALAWTFKFNFDNYIRVNNNLDLENNKNLQTIILNSMTEWNKKMNILNKAAINISLGERKTNTYNLFYGGLSYTKIGKIDNAGSFTITFNENKNYDVTKVLESIYDLKQTSEYFKKGEMYNDDIYNNLLYDNKHIISVRMLNSNILDDTTIKEMRSKIYSETVEGNIKEYKFINCKLVGIESFELNYDSTDTVTRNATFIYDWLYFNNKLDEEISGS